MNKKDNFIIEGLPDKSEWPIFYDSPESQKFDIKVNLVEKLFQKAQMDKVFLRDDKQTFTYNETYNMVSKISEILLNDYKLIQGNRVLLRGQNSVLMALIWLAVVRSGLIAVSTMTMLRSFEINQIISKSLPQLIICENLLLQEITNSNTKDIPIIVFGDDTVSDSLENQLQNKSSDYPASNTNADDIAVLAFTSGTTGEPKAVVHSHKNILESCYAWPKHILKQQSSDIIIGTPPFAFTFGLGGLLLFPMIASASLYFPSKGYNPDSMVDIINKVSATILYTSPTFYNQLSKMIVNKPIPSLRISVSAGEPLSDTLRQSWLKLTGLNMVDGIGATEMFHIFISSSGSDIKAGTIGKVVPGYQAKVVNKSGNELPHGEIGQLAVIGPTGCLYFNDDRQVNYVKNGWNYSGDSFIQDKDGYFKYKSRTDDIIVSSGYNIAAIDVESALCQHPNVLETAVIGVKNEARGKIVKAFIVTKDLQDNFNEVEVIKQLQDFVKGIIAPYKYPREIEFINELPKTNTGKIQRFVLYQKDN